MLSQFNVIWNHFACVCAFITGVIIHSVMVSKDSTFYPLTINWDKSFLFFHDMLVTLSWLDSLCLCLCKYIMYVYIIGNSRTYPHGNFIYSSFSWSNTADIDLGLLKLSQLIFAFLHKRTWIYNNINDVRINAFQLLVEHDKANVIDIAFTWILILMPTAIPKKFEVTKARVI